jgi:AAA domain-containing protein
LIVDADAVTPVKGISATEAEQEQALLIRDQVAHWLTRELGFPAPISGQSGNGGRLLYAIDLPNSAAATKLVRECLAALATRWPAIDKSVYNAARIDKLWGTVAVKGTATEERPHRRTFFDHVPYPIAEVPFDRLVALAGLGTPAAPVRPAGQATAAGVNLVPHFEAKGLYLRPSSKAESMHLVTCPWAEQHSMASGLTETAYFEPSDQNNQAGGFKCQHNHNGSTLTVGDLYRFFGIKPEDPVPHPRQADLVRWRKGGQLDATPLSFLVEDMIPNGMLGALGGKDGRGKTLYGLEIARCVLTGGKLFDRFAVKQGKVFAMLLDDPEHLVRDRLAAMGILDHPDLYVATRADVDMTSPAKMLAFLAAQLSGLDPTFILIDALYLFVPDGGSGDQANSGSAMMPVMAALDEVANRTGATVAVVAHDNKAGGDIGGSRVIRQMFKWIVRLILPREFEDDPEGGVETPERVLQLNKLKTGKPTSWRLRLDGPGAWTFQGTGREYRAQTLQDQIVAHLGELGEPLTAQQIAGGLQKRRQDVTEACKALAAAGRLNTGYRPASQARGAAALYRV